MTPVNKQPLFIVSGASCVGKSTVCEILFRNEKDYIVMESDLLWEERYNVPENDYADFRRLWMRMAANIAQCGKPVVLCGCGIPKQFEIHPERELFTNVYYTALVCDDATMERRMREGRKVTDPGHINSSLDFNRWLRNNADKTTPKITLIDNSDITPGQTAEMLDGWIRDLI